MRGRGLGSGVPHAADLHVGKQCRERVWRLLLFTCKQPQQLSSSMSAEVAELAY